MKYAVYLVVMCAACQYLSATNRVDTIVADYEKNEALAKEFEKKVWPEKDQAKARQAAYTILRAAYDEEAELYGNHLLEDEELAQAWSRIKGYRP